jgi:7-carboxy-7-deazaguanine synthase
MSSEKKFRVAEIFGPTIQGEGRHAGVPCYFVRFGGCDYRCSWCDTPHAVLSDLVSHLPQMTAKEIAYAVNQLEGDPEWVVLSGGNPGLLDLEELVIALQHYGYKVMMETQGSTWREWYSDLDEICFSPKPPSSGMNNTANLVTFRRVIEEWEHWNPHTWQKAYLKIVVFDDDDYAYAVAMHKNYPRYDFFISAGNADPTLPTVGNPNPVQTAPVGDGYLHTLDQTRGVVLDKTRWLFEKVANDPEMANVRVMPQLHTLAWGNQRGR